MREASIATRRFGLGPRPGDVARIATDPRGWVMSALARTDAALLDDPGFETSAAYVVALQDAQVAEQLANLMAKQSAEAKSARPDAPPATPGGAPVASPSPQPSPQPPPHPAPPAAGAPPRAQPIAARAEAVQPPPKPGEVIRNAYQLEAAVRMQRAVSTDQPLVERLVMFWSNHFAISTSKNGIVHVMAGAFEREAIRPYVLGRFADMVKAVEQHPAMLHYLDNVQSIGPDSQNGRNNHRGLNENLARETIELHTLGVDGGYSQADVTSYAKVITGWGVTNQRMIVGQQARARGGGAAGPKLDIMPGQFAFIPQQHEPGEQTILGKRYADKGVVTGEEVLADLARHPSTARHIARKLAAHFIGQTPPPALVARLEKTFRDTDGNLGAVVKALVASPECWQEAHRKVVPPYDFTISLMRAFDIKMPPPEAMRIAAAIGQPLWSPPSPQGWPDDDNAWMGPSAVRERLRIAERAVQITDRKLDPREMAHSLFGDALSPATGEAIARAESREQGFQLLMMSPEFLRR